MQTLRVGPWDPKGWRKTEWLGAPGRGAVAATWLSEDVHKSLGALSLPSSRSVMDSKALRSGLHSAR